MNLVNSKLPKKFVIKSVTDVGPGAGTQNDLKLSNFRSIL